MSAEGDSEFRASHLSPILAHGKACTRLSHELLTWMLQLAGRRVVTPIYSHLALYRRITTDSQASRVPHSTPPWKEPVRGGQNLSQRYERLEKSLDHGYDKTHDTTLLVLIPRDRLRADQAFQSPHL